MRSNIGNRYMRKLVHEYDDSSSINKAKPKEPQPASESPNKKAFSQMKNIKVNKSVDIASLNKRKRTLNE
jgi:hypothetical protein